MGTKPRYLVNRDELPEIHLHPPGARTSAPFVAHMLHGAEASILFAARGPGYHTKPHTHDCEQFNVILEGEIWFFVEEHGYRCRKGDIMRIPRNKLHWAWNRSDAPADLLEVHAPRVTLSSGRERIVSLLGPDEDNNAPYTPQNEYPPSFDAAHTETVEQRAIAEYAGR